MLKISTRDPAPPSPHTRLSDTIKRYWRHLLPTISFGVEAGRHGGSWKKPVVTVVPRLAVSSVSINNVAVTSQSATRWKITS